MIQSIRQSNEEPNEWGIVRKLGMPTLVIRFGITEQETESGVQYNFKEIIGNPGRATYDEFVSAIINFEYPYDRVESVRNNYLLDGDTNEEHRREFEQFQAFRSDTKSLVTRILGEVSQYFGEETRESENLINENNG